MEIPRHWRLRTQRYRLTGNKCENGHVNFPPREVCPDCHGETPIDITTAEKGEVYSFDLALRLTSSLPTEVSMSSR